jgi:Putative phage tail protein
VIALALLLVVALAAPAEAAPVFAAIGAIATTVTSAFAAGGFFTTVVGRLILAVALSALQRALTPKPREPGIKTKVTQTGGTNPQAFPLLKYATAGTHACPPMSHGSVGKTPNAYLTFVVVLSDVAGATLSRYMINGQYVTLGGVADPDYGLPVTGNYNGYAWIKVYTGTQTAADPMLLSRYGIYPERPWTSDMIGRGLVYAICTFRYNRELFPGLPRVKFEMNGIPLYDPRKDTTVGGSGAHRFNNKATWEPSVNPEVAVYNVLRGISLDDGSVYGGNFPAEDVPLASWFAGMNECDLLVTNGAGTEPQFRAGLEVSVDEEPADVIGELLKTCAGNIAEIGGLWKTRVGPPGSPIYLMTDADIVSSSPQDFQPFPNMAGSYNGAHATYPDPEKAWESAEATPYYNATFEAADRNFRLTADLNLTACPYPAQVRRLQYSYVEEERRFRRHEQTLPPDAAVVEPLDATGWTSTWNGYTSKVFEVDQVAEDVMTGLQRVALKERDAADYSYPGLPAPTAISILPVIPAAQTVPVFAVSGTSIPDAGGINRRPALSLTWEPDLADVSAIMWEVRIAATLVIVARGSTQDVAAGALIVSEGILPSTAYEVRARPVVERPSTWTTWVAATTPATLFIRPDLADGAVSDQSQVVSLGPWSQSTAPVGTVLATLAMPPIPPGNGYRRFFSMFLRASNPPVPTRVELQSRKREEGGAFTAWVVLTTFSVTTGTWDQVVDQGGLAGSYDEYEYRLVVLENDFAFPTITTIRDIYLTLTKVTK